MFDLRVVLMDVVLLLVSTDDGNLVVPLHALVVVGSLVLYLREAGGLLVEGVVI